MVKNKQFLNNSQDKIRLVIATDNFLPRKDGIVSFLEEIIPRLQPHFDITVICPDNEQKHVLAGVSFVRIPVSKKKAGDFIFSKAKPRLIKKAIHNADIVFSQTIGPIGGLSLFLAQQKRKKTVSYIHSLEWELASKALQGSFLKRIVYFTSSFLVRFLYSRTTHLLVPSESVSEILLYKRINTPRTIVHLGVDVKKFSPLHDQKKRNEQRARIGLDLEDVAICYHGRLAREKDIPTLLRAFAQVRKKFYGAKLVIIGGGLPQIVSQLQGKKDIIYIPTTSRVQDYLPLCDIFCLPSLTETTSLSTLEAMACELVVISTPVGYIKDYITPHKTGYFFPAGNSYKLAQQILDVISHPLHSKKMGVQARELVCKKFNWDKTAQQLENFFLTMGKKSWSIKEKNKQKHKFKKLKE
ncbi:MAG: glycosyltransferase family 4 protein [Candidatus Woesearchaeota archaeon]